MRRTTLISFALFAASLLLFLINLSQPHGFSFDELFYVPAARGFATWTANTNRVHPPLAKYFIALGIRLFGDTTFGWRFPSAVCGALIVAAMYRWALLLFRKETIAVWVALFALLNQLLYIQARTAMLDIFLFAFLLGGMMAMTAAYLHDADADRSLFVAGALFGLATASKWLGVVPWSVAFALVIVSKLMPSQWFAGTALARVSWSRLVVALVVLPIALYCVTFLPLLWLPGPDASLAGLWQHQFAIWHEHTTANGPPVQAGRWYEWPFYTRQMMYWFERDGERARTVLLRGNPVVLWTGVVALLWCAWSALRERSRTALLIVLWYGALYLSWAVIPRRITYFYYYLPAAMVLSLALGWAALRLEKQRLFRCRVEWLLGAAALAMFAWQWPTSAAISIPLEWIK